MNMKSGKRVLSIIIVSLLLISSISLISAGLWNTITGKATGPQPQNLSITVAGVNPVVVAIQPSSFNDESGDAGIQIDPNELNLPSVKAVPFNVQVSDTDGVTDINDSSVRFEVLEDISKNGSCTLENDIDGNTANYSCSFDMNYWDSAASWTIQVQASDFGAQTIETNTQAFTYRLLSSMTISPTTLTWPAVTPSSINQTATEPTIVTNTGNYNGQISVEAYNLVSATAETVDANEFTIGTITGSDEECNSPTQATVLQNGNPIPIILSNSNPSDGGTEELNYCIPLFPAVSSQEYSTNSALGGISWTISY